MSPSINAPKRAPGITLSHGMGSVGASHIRTNIAGTDEGHHHPGSLQAGRHIMDEFAQGCLTAGIRHLARSPLDGAGNVDHPPEPALYHRGDQTIADADRRNSVNGIVCQIILARIYSRDRNHRAARWPALLKTISIGGKRCSRTSSISSSSVKLPSSAAIGLTCTPKAEHSSTSSSVCTIRRLWTMILEPKSGHCQSNLTADTAGSAGYQRPFTLGPDFQEVLRRIADCSNPKPLNTVNNIIAPIKTGDGDVPQPHFEKLSIHVFVFSYGDDNGGVLTQFAQFSR